MWVAGRGPGGVANLGMGLGIFLTRSYSHMTEVLNDGLLEENPIEASKTLWYIDGYKSAFN